MKIDPNGAVDSIIDARRQKEKIFNSEQEIIAKMIARQTSNGTKSKKKNAESSGKKIRRTKKAAIRTEVTKHIEDTLKALDKVKYPKTDHTKSPLARKAKPFLDNWGKPGNGGVRFEGGELMLPPLHDLDAITQIQCFNAAIRCHGNSCSAATSSIFPFFKSSGLGGDLGWGATTDSAEEWNSLFFLFVPPANGVATATADVILTGNVLASTHPRHTDFPGEEDLAVRRAEVEFRLGLNVWEFSDQVKASFAELADFHVEDGAISIRRFRSERITLQTEVTVTGGSWYLFEVQAWGKVYGRSEFGVGLIDFKSNQAAVDGGPFGIRVPGICVIFESPIVNV